ncbi:MAG: metallophosphoesterase family protein [Acidimicrobiales bacterium]|jgi:DNA repair exonuclease SbcCD nuclease subunit
MKVAAIGDAHLGRSYLPYVAEPGVNQRERDFEISFESAVDLALAQQPDLVVWLGDIFDHPAPHYRSFRVAQRALARIRSAGLPAVVISGNHDTPRLPGRGSPYSVLADAFPEICFAHRLSYERFELTAGGDRIVVHAVPQTMSVEATLEALGEASASRSAEQTNLLLTHPRLKQVEPRHADINEIEVDLGVLQSDLVLLGHYHFYSEVAEHIWYAGSTDTFSFADDPGKDKGIVVLDTVSGSCRHIALTGQRQLMTLESVRALGLSPAELSEQVLARAATVPAGAVARLYLEGVDPEAFRLLDREAVREAAGAALHLDLQPQFQDVAVQAELPQVETLGGQWESWLTHQDLTGLDRGRVRDLGLGYLQAAIDAAG